MLDPAPVGGACDVCEGFVEAHHGVVPCFQYRGFLSCCVLGVSRSRGVRLRGSGWRLLLLVDRSVVNLAHHESDEEGVNAGDGAACVVSRDGDGRM